MSEKNIKLVIAYEGTNYLGWQKTKTGPSIEEALEKVLSIILREKPSLQAASRTDRGVHARGQVVNFISSKDFDLSKLAYSLNCLLPADIRCLSIEQKEISFHPTLDVSGKQYRYYLVNGAAYLPEERLFSWHVPKPLDPEAMEKATHFFIGKHDFSAYCNEIAETAYENTIRKVTRFEIISEKENRFTLIVEGNHFLYKMVRNLVGAIVYAGLGKIKPEKIAETLLQKKRIFAEVTAPAKGLFLQEVFYNTSK